ncbi:hypothetical protein Daura_13625 [Dactylosporangium aurantiacum]|uniref:Uncharacterized protein n=1 Tax=Dactylosporangium aurantiacum TaxID=35754 RepID=A0A9Q9ILL3_9ACTN|nr:hypothetical protein [Dactylosporangium aurantiacum]MDG6105548.1 hypothetical protein [Dactylosporangium aurantiacum]UWZ57108.1 hypothetical protein Daura_13625 [Dactylosporangium aurantiacum]
MEQDFWRVEPGWVLHDFGDGGYLPFNDLTSMAHVVCDDEADRVVAGMLGAGCPVRLMPRDDGPPTHVIVFVDRVPPDGLKTLVELRRLLHRSWPFAGLRDLLTRQPILAGGAELAALRDALDATPRLRPFLFYETRRGGLVPVWTG